MADVKNDPNKKQGTIYKRVLQRICQMGCSFADVYDLDTEKRVCCNDGKIRKSLCFFGCEQHWTNPGLDVNYPGPYKAKEETKEPMQPNEAVESIRLREMPKEPINQF